MSCLCLKGTLCTWFQAQIFWLVKPWSTSESSPGKSNMKCFNRIVNSTYKTIKYRYSCSSWLFIIIEKERDTASLVPASRQKNDITFQMPLGHLTQGKVNQIWCNIAWDCSWQPATNDIIRKDFELLLNHAKHQQHEVTLFQGAFPATT